MDCEPIRLTHSSSLHRLRLRPAPICESAHILPTGLFASNTIAAAILQRWLAPVEARRAPAATPLLVVGRSAWDAVHSVVAASAGSYPNNYPFLPAAELPRDETSLMLLRANANKPIISVALPSVASAAALAPAVRNLQAKMPQHSWCFFAPQTRSFGRTAMGSRRTYLDAPPPC